MLVGILITNVTFAGSSHMFTFKSINGEENIKLSDFSGKAVLVVNTASRCGFTSQSVSYTHLTLPTILLV